jgi:hypothetical protein
MEYIMPFQFSPVEALRQTIIAPQKSCRQRAVREPSESR